MDLFFSCVLPSSGSCQKPRISKRNTATTKNLLPTTARASVGRMSKHDPVSIRSRTPRTAFGLFAAIASALVFSDLSLSGGSGVVEAFQGGSLTSSTSDKGIRRRCPRLKWRTEFCEPTGNKVSFSLLSSPLPLTQRAHRTAGRSRVTTTTSPTRTSLFSSLETNTETTATGIQSDSSEASNGGDISKNGGAMTSPESDNAPSAKAVDAKKIDGKAIAADIRNELKARVEKMTADGYPTPGLAVVLVGSRRDSQTYVRMKKKACAQAGIESFGYDYDEDVTQDELLTRVRELNADDRVHGILVQLPLPDHLDETAILEAIDPQKDVDGLHPINVAKLATQGTHGGRDASMWRELDRVPFSIPCTPLGCIELLDRSGVEIAGKNAVVVGRSNLVGLPVSFLLLHRNATVTIVHSKTTDIKSVVRQADIVIAAVGRAQLVTGEWLKPGATVIDVGINSVDVDDPKAKKPYKLVGDVDYDSAAPVCAKITPVPGGVGPMTIAMLLRNTVNACRRAHDAQRG